MHSVGCAEHRSALYACCTPRAARDAAQTRTHHARCVRLAQLLPCTDANVSARSFGQRAQQRARGHTTRGWYAAPVARGIAEGWKGGRSAWRVCARVGAVAAIRATWASGCARTRVTSREEANKGLKGQARSTAPSVKSPVKGKAGHGGQATQYVSKKRSRNRVPSPLFVGGDEEEEEEASGGEEEKEKRDREVVTEIMLVPIAPSCGTDTAIANMKKPSASERLIKTGSWRIREEFGKTEIDQLLRTEFGKMQVKFPGEPHHWVLTCVQHLSNLRPDSSVVRASPPRGGGPWFKPKSDCQCLFVRGPPINGQVVLEHGALPGRGKMERALQVALTHNLPLSVFNNIDHAIKNPTLYPGDPDEDDPLTWLTAWPQRLLPFPLSLPALDKGKGKAPVINISDNKDKEGKGPVKEMMEGPRSMVTRSASTTKKGKLSLPELDASSEDEDHRPLSKRRKLGDFEAGSSSRPLASEAGPLGRPRPRPQPRPLIRRYGFPSTSQSRGTVHTLVSASGSTQPQPSTLSIIPGLSTPSTQPTASSSSSAALLGLLTEGTKQETPREDMSAYISDMEPVGLPSLTLSPSRNPWL
ncbi:hypothetical protein BD626DRAFT_586812 [Schizophyllum amplum]|uniref:Uncharacterized protein n=1 Tax=Schizophyllum amplum TaxID=97359 RepID=A0A550BXC2_9AGAR|nr:hypothetical protein BD626DRAFT_586812 [Auriculariopsis ampla]